MTAPRPQGPTSSAPLVLQSSVRVQGVVRGQAIERDAIVELHAESLLFAWADATPWQVGFEGLDGVVHGPAQCTLYLSGGDVLELQGDDGLRALALQIEGRACTMPELTRGLRSFGSLRGAPGAAHDAWFAPLLSARRAVEGVSDPERQLGVLDAAALAAAMSRALEEIAALQVPNDPAERRAVEAVLEEEAEAMMSSLDRLAIAAEALRGSAADTRIAEWRRWIAVLRDVYAAADEGWGRARSIIR